MNSDRFLDTKLLVAFDALMRERQVSRAARSIDVTQSALSQTLARMRTIFNDPLFIRGADGMEPTPVALSLAGPISRALSHLSSIVTSSEVFNPKTAQFKFRVIMSDNASYLFLPGIMKRLRKEAPGVSLIVMNGGFRDGPQKLSIGHAELGIGVYENVPAGIEYQELSEIPFICIADKNNPNVKNGTMALKTFLEAPHVGIAINDDPGIHIDFVLEALHLNRNVVLVVPHFLAIPGVIRGTDMISVFSSSVLDTPAFSKGLIMFPSPVPVPEIRLQVAWHSRMEHDPAHKWIRDLIIDEVKAKLASLKTPIEANKMLRASPAHMDI